MTTNTLPVTIGTLIEALQQLAIAYQQVRSVHQENFSRWPMETVEELFRWTRGAKCPLPAIVKLLDARDRWDRETYSGVYNLLSAAYQFSPEVVIHCHTMARFAGVPSPLWEELPNIKDILKVFEEEYCVV